MTGTRLAAMMLLLTLLSACGAPSSPWDNYYSGLSGGGGVVAALDD